MIDWYVYSRYFGGFFVFLCLSLIGFWLILRAIQGKQQFLNGLLNVPSWLLIITGIIFQAPFLCYTYLGIRAGFYQYNLTMNDQFSPTNLSKGIR
jgi:hypothetical protein